MLQTQARRVALRAGVSGARHGLVGRLPVSASGLKRPHPLQLTPASAASIHTTSSNSDSRSARLGSKSDFEDADSEGGSVLSEEALREALLSDGELSLEDFERFESEMGIDDDMDDPTSMFKASVTEPQRMGESEAELFGSEVSSEQVHSTLTTHSIPAGRMNNLDPRTLPIPITDLADLGPNFTEEAYASALIHGRSIHTPFIHPSTLRLPVASIQFLSHHPRLLTLFSHFALHAASALGIPTSRSVIPLPTERKLWTVPRSPFVHKKSQENFERRTYKRMIKAWDADPEIVDRWVRYLRMHEMGGVGFRVTRWERVCVGFGRERLERVRGVLSDEIASVTPTHAVPAMPIAALGAGAESTDPDVRLSQVEGEIDSSASRKKAIQALGEKIVRVEMLGNVVDANTRTGGADTSTKKPEPKANAKGSDKPKAS